MMPSKLTMMYGFKKTINGPMITIKSHSQDTKRNLRNLCPFDQEFCFAIYGYPYTVPSISRLFRSRSPSAIFRTVSQIIIDSIKFQLRRAHTHIGKELLKVVSPLFTNCNSSASIIFVVFVSRIVAAALYMQPRSIFAREMVSDGMSMLPECFAHGVSRSFLLTWRATLSAATNQVAMICAKIVSAITETLPITMGAVAIQELQRYSPVKSPSFDRKHCR